MAEIDVTNPSTKAEAEKLITESIRDLLTLKINLPLGNPAFKYVHTNLL